MKKTALITGGNKGIGLEVTRYFLDRNFDIEHRDAGQSQYAIIDGAEIVINICCQQGPSREGNDEHQFTTKQ